MKKKGRCAICGGKVIYNEKEQRHQCSKCKAYHDPRLFIPAKRSVKNMRLKVNVKWLVAILGTLYLLWLTYRIFIYGRIY